MVNEQWSVIRTNADTVTGKLQVSKRRAILAPRIV